MNGDQIARINIIFMATMNIQFADLYIGFCALTNAAIFYVTHMASSNARSSIPRIDVDNCVWKCNLPLTNPVSPLVGLSD